VFGLTCFINIVAEKKLSAKLCTEEDGTGCDRLGAIYFTACLRCGRICSDIL